MQEASDAARRDLTEERRNARLIVLNGGLMQFAMSFASLDTVIPAFVQTLTGSSFYVGLSRSMIRIGWSWPQIFISRVIEERTRKKPLFLKVGMGRAAAWFGIGVATWMLAGERPTVVLAAFFALYAIATSLMGVMNVPWMDVIGKTVPSGGRGRVFALRRLIGGGLAVASGGVISFILSDRSGFGFPKSYAVLFLISGILTVVAVLVFGLVREPVEEVRSGREPFWSYLKGGFGLLREDDDFRRLFLLRYVWSAAIMGSPFYVPYALSELGIGVVFVGLFVSVSQAALILSNAVWAWVSGRWGNRTLLIWGAGLMALAIAVPVTTPWVPDVSLRPLAAFGSDFGVSSRVLYFSLTFVLHGFAVSGNSAGRMAMVLDLAPPDRRPTYTSFMNTMGVLQGVIPVLAGLLAGWISYRYMFLVSLLFIPAAILLALRISPAQAYSRSAS